MEVAPDPWSAQTPPAARPRLQGATGTENGTDVVVSIDVRAKVAPLSATPPSPPSLRRTACLALQRGLGHLEQAFIAADAPQMPDRPVFVTGLPCGGAAQAFSLLAGSGHFACYRRTDGPFVAAPRLSRQIDRVLHRRGSAPAALDEALWLSVYGQAALSGCTGADDLADGQAKMVGIIARLCAMEGGKRYIGKNAGLMTRLPALKRAFPDAVVVAAFRDPVAQLADLGDDDASRADWLRYWIGAYRRAASLPGVVLLDADRLFTEGRPILRRLAQATGTPESPLLLGQMPSPLGSLRRMVPKCADAPPHRRPLPPTLMAEARALHWLMSRTAI